MSRKRWRLLAAVAVIAVLVAAAARLAGDARRGGRGTASGSSFRADESGLLGARRLLEALGYDVESRRGARLPKGTGHVLVRVEGGPQHRERVAAEEAAEIDELEAWVRRGNGLLLLAQPIAGAAPGAGAFPRLVGSGPPPFRSEVPDVEGAVTEAAEGEKTAAALDEVFGPDRPSVPAPSASDITVMEPPGLEAPVLTGAWRVLTRDGDVVLARRGEEAVIAERRLGEGRVVVVADPWFATNARLPNHPENASWTAVLADRLLGGGSVWFDDRAAGVPASRGVLSLFGEVGLGPALGAAFLLLLLAAWRAAPSDAPERFVRPDVEYRPEQLALQRGDLYASCLSAEEARRIVRDEVARRIGRGDATGFERALALLQARDPDRARRIRARIAELPEHPHVTLQRHPDTWCEAVAAVVEAVTGHAESASGRHLPPPRKAP